MSSLAFAVYRFVVVPLAWTIFQIGAFFGGTKWKSLRDAKNSGAFTFSGMNLEKIRDLRPLWVHAASGEIEYARPVIRRWKELNPNVPVIVTYGSPSAVRILQKMSDVDAYGAVPWEFPSHIRAFIDQFQPRALLVARTDVWPVLITEVHSQKIPSLLFAATFARESSRLTGVMRAITARSLRQLGGIQVVSLEDQTMIADLVSEGKIEVTGDTRFDQVMHRLKNPTPVRESLRPSKHPVLVAGSTWPEDEDVLIAALKNQHHWQLLLAPHEVSEARIARLEEKLKSNGFSSQRYGKSEQWTERVLLLDQVGILAELYTWGDAAFVGGSFKKLVHSVMEPLAAGQRVLVGPHHENNREALEFKTIKIKDLPAVCVVKNTEEMMAMLANPNFLGAEASIQHEVQKRTGATEKVIRWTKTKVP